MNRDFADISSNNGTVNIDAYHDAGYRVLMIKASEGLTYVNPLHRGQALACGLRHMIVVHYHFARPDEGHKPQDEAMHFLRATSGLLGPRDYVVLDVERGIGGNFARDPAWTRAFDAKVREFSRFSCILYASRSVLAQADNWLDQPHPRCHDADYSTTANFAPKGYRCAFRQFTDGVFGPEPHRAPGIGACDMNHVTDEAIWQQMVESQRAVK